jgi:L-fuculose-phosphate aldolase
MTEQQHREFLCEIGRRLYARGFVAANDGNLTVRLGEGVFLCTPTMTSKGFLRPEDLCLVDADGRQLAGPRPRTSEVLLHLAIYRTRPDVQAVVHCHPPHATAFAIAGEPIPKGVLAEVEVFLGEVPLTKYETPGTQQFADTIVPYVRDCNTIVLANHGTVTFGTTLEQAWFHTEIIDAYCRILLLARPLGRINTFTPTQMAELLALKKRLGYDDVRFRRPEQALSQDSSFDHSYSDYVPQPRAFRSVGHDRLTALETPCERCGIPASADRPTGSATLDVEELVRTITHQVLAALSARA